LKFKPSEGDIDVTEKALVQFIDSVLSGTLKAYVRSEPEPEDPRESFTPGSVLVNAVATNFDKLVVEDIKRDILVVYHAPWCGFCRKLMPTLRELGTKLAHAGKGLKVVKIDATRNEVPQVSIAGYPTIMLYTATDAVKPINERKAVQYNGDRSIDDIISFLHSNAVNSFPDQAPLGTTSDQELHYAFEEL
jgi:protein disulfide-isomerase A1